MQKYVRLQKYVNHYTTGSYSERDQLQITYVYLQPLFKNVHLSKAWSQRASVEVLSHLAQI